MKLASFDIFDTTLIRKCGLPENVFYVLARRLFPDDVARQEDFLLWRKGAEGRARLRVKGEVSLVDIYADESLAAYGAGDAQYMMSLERQMESELLMAVPSVRELIAQKRQEGYHICFISDMYLDSAFLESVLRREGCLQGEERVYVSCEHGVRKSDGKLFDKVRAELQPSVWEHYGDHSHSDVKMPRRRGIAAMRIANPYADIEHRIINEYIAQQEGRMLSCLAGLSRAARLLHGSESMAEIAADFVAPAYLPYVSYILQDARRRGIKKLYFLSRDSYVLMRAAEEQLDRYPEMEFHYLFVSRKALILPYMRDATSEAYLAVQDQGSILRRRVKDLLAGLGLTRAELEQNFQLSFDYEKIYGCKEQEDFLEKIWGNTSPLLPVLKKKINEQRVLLLDYFRQEGLMAPGIVGMVDVGWLGTSRHMINSILKSEGGADTHFYYFGIRRDVMPWSYGAYSSFYRPEQLSTELTALVENYFSASPYPSTISYGRAGDKVVPVFAQGKEYTETAITNCHCRILRWMLQEMRAMQVDCSAALVEWARISLAAITHLAIKVDLSALASASDFDQSAFVRRLSLPELVCLTFMGANVTAFDRASLLLSSPRGLARCMWKLHEFSARIRRYLYLKMR